jgi:hypothetical protein
MQHLYDYFDGAEDPRAQAEELLWCCSGEFFQNREYTGRLPVDLEAVLDNLLDKSVDHFEVLEDVFTNHPKLWDALLEFRDEFFVEYRSEEAPSWVYLTPWFGNEIYGWLIHFSDTAYDIAYEGFCRGVPSVNKLGLTTRLSSYEFDTEGYNFAYPADIAVRFAFDRGTPKYGKHAVLFRAPYMLFNHLTDQEPQAIFWGPSARDIIVIDFEYREPVLEVTDTLVLVDDSGESVALWPDDEGEEAAYELQDEHGGEWTDRLEFADVDEMLEWLEGPPISGRPRLSLFDPLSKPECVIRHRKRRGG